METRLKLSDVERIAATVKGPEFAARLRAAGRLEGEWLFVERAHYATIYNSTGIMGSVTVPVAVPGVAPGTSGFRLGDLVEKLAKPIAKALHLGCLDPATQQLRPESGCAKRKAALNDFGSEVPRFDLHGGLGDCFLDLFERPVYQWLGQMKETDRARVVIWSSNLFAPELFAWHPKRSQIEVLSCPNWTSSSDDQACAQTLGIKPPRLNRSLIPRVPEGGLELEFYPSPADLGFLEELRIVADGRPMIVIAPGAGELHRNIPDGLLDRFEPELIRHGCFLVQVGRSYARGPRKEPPCGRLCYDAIDRLSVPGTARLLQLSAGLVTAHSSMNILGWFLRKPQLLLAPSAVFEQHLAKPTRWGFGARHPETITSTFDAFTSALTARFLTQI